MSDPFRGGEDAFVQRLVSLFRGIPASGVVVGIGDDAAVLPGRPVRVVTADQLVESQHFRFGLISDEHLAVRALEANLSDIAAMGARPEAVLLCLSWPPGRTASRRAGRFLRGLAAACRRRAVPLVGGDVTRAAPGATSITITALGRAWPGGPVLRSGGGPGDPLAVTGPLGGAAAGLAILERRMPRGRGAAERSASEAAVSAFRTPRARLDAARPLARHASALIDLSDGLGLDLPRLARASRCGFVVEAERIPVHPGAALAGSAGGLRLAISGGEDFELLAAIPEGRLEAARSAVRRAGAELHVLGRLTSARRGWIAEAGRRRPWPRHGWDPFAEPRRRRLDVPNGRSVGQGGRAGPAG